jgi:two-component system CheB/CheR fusion protein
MSTDALRILLVEDNPGDADLLREKLATLDQPIDIAHVGRLAEAEVYLKRGAPVDVVLLDLGLAETQGLETLERAQRAIPQLPIIVLSGLEDEPTALEAVRKGAQDYQVKGDVQARSLWRALHHAVERKRAEEEVRLARDSAERANRAKDHFLAALSHELRTPLTPVMMAVSLLQQRTDLDAKTREMLEMICRNVEMEARLIDDLLDVSRIAQGKIELQKQRVELRAVLERAVEVCKPDIEARRLEFGLDWGAAGPYWLEADVPRLQQVFWNLLKNAVKFTSNGGCVGIRCRPEEQQVLVEVNDSGIGIETEALPRIFNAFEQAERSITRQFGGLGLGLTISKALVEMHGGTIEAHSMGRGMGSTFRIRLPLSAPVAGSEELSASAASRRIVRPLRILLVEDHGVTAKMLRMVLTEEGHAVETAGDVATALRLSDQNAYDLLLSDLGLPDGSGHDLMRQLRQRGHRFPGIALSGYGQEEDIQRSHEAGFVAHLTKPASREAVVQAVAAFTTT